MFTDAKEFGAFVTNSKCATRYGEMYEGSGIFFATTEPTLFNVDKEYVSQLANRYNGRIVE